MKDQKRQTEHRLAAVLSLALALVAGGALAATVVWSGDKGNGSMSDGGNWYGNAAPAAGDTLDFGNIDSAKTLNADFEDDRVFATATFGSGVVTMSGSLHVNTLTNACNLAVASGATLKIDGELVLTQDAGTSAWLLYSNEGTVIVGGKTICYTRASTTTNYSFFQYKVATENTQPLRTKGLAYDCGGKARLYLQIYSKTDGDKAPNKWIVGSDGLSFSAARQASYSHFYTQQSAPVVIGSAADWTLANSGKGSSEEGDLYALSGASITLDTSNCDDPSIGHVITLKGRALINANAANPGLVVKGCGKVVVNTTGSNTSLTEVQQNTCVNTALAVIDTATLQVNKGKKIMGSGTVSLASGTKLLVPDASATVGLPSLAPAAGSTIVVTNLTAGAPAISLSGSLTMPAEGNVALKIGGATQLEDGIYTVLSAANALPEGAVEHFTLDASEVVSDECSLYTKGGVLLLLVGIAEPGYGIWVGGTDAKLSTAANWLNGETPRAGDTLNFKTVGAATTINADFEDNRVFETAVFGSGVVTLTGNLYLNTLKNAYTLAVASGAKLCIAGDLVSYAANNTKPLLYSNEGIVEVGGMVRFRANSLVNRAVSTVCQYAVTTADTTPIIANGIAYHADKQSNNSWYPDYLAANLGSMNNGAGNWVVGEAGLSFPVSRDIDYSGFRIFGQQDVALHSSANWTLDESYRKYGTDLYIRDSGKVTIDTTDYNDHTTSRTVTLKGYINAQGSAATPLTITGCGTVVLDSKTANNHTNVVTGAIAVTDGAMLQINKDVVVGGNGTISLAAGTTLALPANVDRTFTTREIVPVTLPEEGKATLKIDAEHSLRIGEYVILNSVPAGYAEHLAVEGTALGGRKASLKDDGENLVLDVKSAGVMLVFR